ncbi:FecCD family ABC transporter permease [Roseateles violae]|uniref:Iron ABC transporter permease n=1 Tax=Roseateles violae TaxID=3058042 RepID=A0ABT8DXR0_9BURK|nr:iron ABC transporter permease [Pelomonas sp. PFR6]MDN3922393.1 iron ABC transporter permease [Pelomonas sp. PFR6]
MRRPAKLLVLLLALSLALLLLGLAVGSSGFDWGAGDAALARQILLEIRLPRSLGAWCAGALLGLAGAVAQGLFRNPLADPYLLGSASGAGLAVAIALVASGSAVGDPFWLQRLGLSGAAFIGTLAGVLLTLALARGAEQGLRLLLAGVVVGVVLTALTQLLMLLAPDIMRAMQAFILGTTGLLGWSSVALMAAALLIALLIALGGARALDALSLGEATAASLGLRLGRLRVALLGAFALATGTAVAQAGMIAFVGLVAPHLVRRQCASTHGWLLALSACAGGVLLLAADVASRWLVAPQELPVGIVTAVLGGVYLLALMHRRTGAA